MVKTIKINESTHIRLSYYKLENKFDSFDQAIKKLLNTKEVE